MPRDTYMFQNCIFTILCYPEQRGKYNYTFSTEETFLQYFSEFPESFEEMFPRYC